MSIRYDTELLPDIKVIGVGGGGCNAVNRMIRAKIPGVTFVACNTDAQALMSSEASNRIRIGEKLTKGLGVGGDPARGERAADESREEIYDLLRGTEMVFVTAGMGGGTGTGAAPVVAEIAKDVGALTIGVVTKPFAWEGARRMKQAEEGLARMRDKVDTLIAIPNSRLTEICAPDCTVDQAFDAADDVLRQAIQSISNIISQNGSINLDFNDVRTTMSEAGPALLAVGSASGENRAVEAARDATNSPLLDQSIDGAHNVLFNVAHSGNLQLREQHGCTRQRKSWIPPPTSSSAPSSTPVSATKCSSPLSPPASPRRRSNSTIRASSRGSPSLACPVWRVLKTLNCPRSYDGTFAP
jgi:cell division protein FtsZ